MHRQLRKGIVIGLVPLVIGAISWAISDRMVNAITPLLRLESTLESQLRRMRPLTKPQPTLHLITIDERSGMVLPKSASGALSRKNYVDLIEKLSDAGARVIAVDWHFTKLQVKDTNLADCFDILGTTKLVLATSSEAEDYDAGEPIFDPLDHLGQIPPNVLVASVNGFETDDLAGAIVLMDRDAARKVQVPHFALATAAAWKGVESKLHYSLGSTVLRFGDQTLNCNIGGEYFIRWSESKPDRPETPLHEALKLTAEEAKAKFGGKIVVVGDVRESSNDMVDTPLGPMAGVYFQAQAIESILSTDQDRYLASWVQLALTVFAGGLASFAMFIRRRPWMPALVVAFAGALVLPASIRYYSGHVTEHIPLFLSPVLGLALSAPLRGRLQDWLMAPGRPFPAIALFVDIRGSTPLLSNLGAESYSHLFRMVLHDTKQPLTRFGAILERPLGDGALVLVPGGDVAAATKSVDLAKELMTIFQNRNLECGIGLEVGEMVGQFVLEGEHHTWSSFGPAINAASRIQDLTKNYTTSILIGPSLAALLGDSAVDPIGQVELRGIEGKVSIYQLRERLVHEN